MGKRSSFERLPRDFYATPFAAVTPLVPHLLAAGVKTFAEPCFGNGDLARHLESFGLRCVAHGDIATGQDARLLTLADCNGAHAIITNPPHRRDAMHRLLMRFVATGLPTWLLLPADWLCNLEAAPHLRQCSTIAIIGRVKWFADSRHASMENFAWYQFSAAHIGATTIHNNREKRPRAKPLRLRVVQQPGASP